MRPRLQDDLHVVGISKGAVRIETIIFVGRAKGKRESSHETKSSRTARFVVLHHYTVNDFTIATKVSLQAVLGRLPTEASDKKFPTSKGSGAKQKFAIKNQKMKKKLSHHQKKKGSIFEN